MTPLAGRNAFAAAPAGIKGSGIYAYKVGDYEIVQLMDGARTFPMPDGFIVNASKDKAIAAAEAAYMPDGKITIPFSPMIINTGSKLVAIDTGNGLGAFAANKGAVGQTRGNMEAAGIDPKSVDIVLISHFHGDHIGGLKNADGSPAYPNAEIKVPAVEWAFWTDDANQSKANGFNKAQFPIVKKMHGRAEGHPVRGQQGNRPRHHVGVHARSYAGPHLVCGGVRLGAHAGAVRRLQYSVAVHAQRRPGRRSSTTIRT